MLRREELYNQVKDLVKQCNRCGFCRAVCPSLHELGWECTSPRGRLFLAEKVLSGELPLTDDITKWLDQCLLCRNCVAACSTGTKTDEVLLAFRQFVEQEKGTPLIKKVLLGVLGDQRDLFATVSPVANVLEHIPFKETESGGAVFRLYSKMRLLPMVGNKPLLSQVKRVESKNPVRKVAYYVGCFTNFMGANVGRSVINVLTRNGCTVELPQAQVCCGVPYFASGQMDKAVSMVRQNIDALLECQADAIVYSCGSCGTGLKEWAQIPQIGKEYVEKAKRLEEKLFEVGQYLVDELKIESLPKFPQKIKVTYHDSCHLAGEGITEQPRKILNMMENVDYVEMPDANTCCGMGGLFAFVHYDMARKINEHKIKNILEVTPDVITSGCPGCNLHIMDGLNKAGSKVKTNHYIELVSNAYDFKQVKESK